MICSKAQLSISVALLFCCTSAFAQWEAPASYYSNVDDTTGATLKARLTAAMSAGHIEREYGDFRFSAAIHDQDPANSSNILLVYDRRSNNSTWDSAATWNREHVWPQSKQPGTASNSSMGNLGDPHALRPSSVGVNSDRGSMPFGLGNTTGMFGDLGAFWYPGDVWRGDIARSLFYSDTRWTSLGIRLVGGNPTAENRMGDLTSLIQWHYLDPPDEFERRRNHTIFSSQYNPLYYTNNRNAYVDRPEFVWSVYVDQRNDSTITFAGSATSSNGSSVLDIDFGSVIVGTSVDASQSVTLNKSGNDGTYYSVQTMGNAQSEVEGFYNAFRTNGVDSRSFDVLLSYDPQTAGEYEGMIMVDNLDVTTEGGFGNGACDGNDFAGLALKVVEHANASFVGDADMNVLTVDMGELPLDEPITPVDFSIFNLASPAGSQLTARLDLSSVDTVPQSSFLTLSDSQFENLSADEFIEFSIEGTPSVLGVGSTEFVLNLSDEDIPGAQSQNLRLIVTYDVVAAIALLGDVNLDGVVDFFDIAPFISILSSGFQTEADIDQNGVVDFFDIAPFIEVLSVQ